MKKLEIGIMVAYIAANKRISFGRIIEIKESVERTDRYKYWYVIEGKEKVQRYLHEIEVVPSF
jgi:hypothetical protein